MDPDPKPHPVGLDPFPDLSWEIDSTEVAKIVIKQCLRLRFYEKMPPFVLQKETTIF
jgi:hypothetical protein